MTCKENVVLTYHPDTDDHNIESLLRTLGLRKTLAPDDFDHRINNDTQMIYCNDPATGSVNYAATRILVDHFLYELPRVSDDVDVFEYAPRGPVVFMTKQDPRTFQRNWPLLFTDSMPYCSLRKRYTTNWYDLYRKADTSAATVHDILTTDARLTLAPQAVTAAHQLVVDSTIAACIMLDFVPRWFVFSKTIPLLKIDKNPFL